MLFVVHGEQHVIGGMHGKMSAPLFPHTRQRERVPRERSKNLVMTLEDEVVVLLPRVHVIVRVLVMHVDVIARDRPPHGMTCAEGIDQTGRNIPRAFLGRRPHNAFVHGYYVETVKLLIGRHVYVFENHP